MTLKYIGIEPCEPIVFYNPNSKNSTNQQLSHKSTFDSFQFISKNTKDFLQVVNNNLSNNISAIQNENSNIQGDKAKTNNNNNDTNENNDKDSKSKSLGTKISIVNNKKNKIERKAKDEFLNEVMKNIKLIDYAPQIDLTDI